MASAAPVSTGRPLFILLTLLGAGLAVLIQVLPFGTFKDVPLAPVLALVALFYWAVYVPEVCPTWVAFLTGLFQDIVSGGPLGLWALVYVVVFRVVLQNRLLFVGRAAYSGWAGFAMAAILATALAWAAGSVYFGQPLSPTPILGQMMVTVLCYPPLAWIMLKVGRFFGVVEPTL
ncbi:MAG: rod shape-determining protein MreD [Alphaproteobacteria bacterium]